MAKQSTPAQPGDRQPQKLSKLPKGAKIHKRPLLHPAIPSPYTSAGASTQKTIYVSTKTPFMAAVKRVKSLLSHVEKRGMQAELARGRGRGGSRGGRRGEGRMFQVRRDEPSPEQSANHAREEEVMLKATGRAVDKALSVALFLQSLGDLNVQVRTGSVGAIDDIDADMVEEEAERHDNEGESQELPESRVRMTSVIEIAVSLKS